MSFSYGYYKRKLSDLKMVDDLYYIGDIYDVDGNPWVDAEAAQQILDIVNQEELEKTLESDQLRRDLSRKTKIKMKGEF